MQVTVEDIIKAGQLVESELRAQARRLKEVLPRDADEAKFLSNTIDEYEASANGVNKLTTHQQKRLNKLAAVAASEASAPYTESMDREAI